ncbi:MAG TPA: hypothetical protein VGM56_11725 [Byssovorax sp.]
MLALTIALCGCAATPPPRYVRAADLGSSGAALASRQPLIIEFERGDVIPLHFTLDGPFVRTADDAPVIPLRAVRHFFLRIDENGVKASPDGKDFDWSPSHPGSFRIGLGASKQGKGPLAEVVIHTPALPDAR